MRAILTIVVVLGLSACRSASAVAPARTDHGTPPRVLTYRSIGGRQLAAYVFAPKAPASNGSSAAILLFHGGGWSMGSPEWTFGEARHFADLGMVAIPVQYRLSRPAYGEVESWQKDLTPIDAVSDVCAAYAWVREHAAELGVDPRRVAGFGVSAGGHLLAAAATVGCPPTREAGAHSGPDALLLWSAALDLAEDVYFKGLLQGKAAAAEYSPVEHVSKATPPTSIVHGAKDSLTPLAGARRFCERVAQLGIACELNAYDGVGHLLTRNLAEQERDFDPDPVAAADGAAKQRRFLERLGFARSR